MSYKSIRDMEPSERWRYWPNLNEEDFSCESESDNKYNCVAWSLGIIDDWIDPANEHTWPPDIEKSYNINSYIRYFEKRGYSICDNDKYDESIEKIALYVDNIGEFSHVALQIGERLWASKLGSFDDIYHKNLECLTGTNYKLSQYGEIHTFMCRKKRTGKRKTK